MNNHMFRRTIVFITIILILLITYGTVNAFWIRRGASNTYYRFEYFDFNCTFTVQSVYSNAIFPDPNTEVDARLYAETTGPSNYPEHLYFLIGPRGQAEVGRYIPQSNLTVLARAQLNLLNFVDPPVAIGEIYRVQTGNENYSFLFAETRISWPYNIIIEPDEELILAMGSRGSNNALAIFTEIPSCSNDWVPDHRENIDAGASVVAYCEAYGIAVYYIDDESNGHLSFISTFEEIAAIGEPDVNTLIESGPSFYEGTSRLFRLSTGEFQINGPKADGEYVYIWDGCEQPEGEP